MFWDALFIASYTPTMSSVFTIPRGRGIDMGLLFPLTLGMSKINSFREDKKTLVIELFIYYISARWNERKFARSIFVQLETIIKAVKVTKKRRKETCTKLKPTFPHESKPSILIQTSSLFDRLIFLHSRARSLKTFKPFTMHSLKDNPTILYLHMLCKNMGWRSPYYSLC